MAAAIAIISVVSRSGRVATTTLTSAGVGR
jgi:hypothetical protein